MLYMKKALKCVALGVSVCVGVWVIYRFIMPCQTTHSSTSDREVKAKQPKLTHKEAFTAVSKQWLSFDVISVFVSQAGCRVLSVYPRGPSRHGRDGS